MIKKCIDCVLFVKEYSGKCYFSSGREWTSMWYEGENLFHEFKENNCVGYASKDKEKNKECKNNKSISK